MTYDVFERLQNFNSIRRKCPFLQEGRHGTKSVQFCLEYRVQDILRVGNYGGRRGVVEGRGRVNSHAAQRGDRQEHLDDYTHSMEWRKGCTTNADGSWGVNVVKDAC